MSTPTRYSLSVSRVYGYARTLVWECLTDDVLLDGWLGAAAVEAWPGGGVAVIPDRGSGAGVVAVGTVTRYEPLSRMVWSFDDGAIVSFRVNTTAVDPLESAISRDCAGSTLLQLQVTSLVAPDSFDTVSHSWSSRLRHLDALLAGRPSTTPKGRVVPS